MVRYLLIISLLLGLFSACTIKHRAVIVFEATGETASDIYLLDLQNKQITKLTNNGKPKGTISWDHKGNIYFDMLDNNWDIYKLSLHSGKLENLTNHPSADTTPCCSAEGGQIVFSSNRDGNWEIYSMDVESKKVRRLTYNPAEDSFPCLSPDGKYIVFLSTRERKDSGHDVFIMDANGANVKRLTTDKFVDCTLPRWSPNGENIIFTATTDKAHYNYNLYIMDKNGKNIRSIVQFPGRKGDASFSPDGEKIIFIGEPSNKDICSLFIMDRKSGKIKSLVQFQRSINNLRCPIFSPDGLKIAYIGAKRASDIYLTDWEGKTLKCLTGHRGRNITPSLSPDGRKVAFSSNRDGNWEIYVMDLGSGKVKRLTHNPAIDIEPCWSPDGREIVFSSDRKGKWEIYIVGIDGKNERCLTEGFFTGLSVSIMGPSAGAIRGSLYLK